MLCKVGLTLALLLATASAARPGVGFFSAPTHPTQEYPEMLDDEPLILSHLPPHEARAASKVSGAGLDNGTSSYAGFFVTQKETNNSMFFWFFEAQEPKVANPPLLIWLQGGPGGSSMFALFSEMGPYELVQDGKAYAARRRETTWNKEYSMLFIDNPVGAGFSFTTTDAGYCTDTKECVSRNLYSLLQQFYTVFPEQLKSPLYVTGESYGGHYVPGISYYIHTHNKAIAEGTAQGVMIPLAGLAVGDGWIDPVNMIPAYPAMMFNQGLIDDEQRVVIQKMCDESVANIKAGKMSAAFDVWDRMLNGDIWPYGNLFHNYTGLNDYDNYMNTNAPASFGFYPEFLNQANARAALHVGAAKFPSNPRECEMHLVSDFMASFRDELSVLLDNYKVLIYSGQLDVIIGAALTERFLPNVQWRGQAKYNAAPRAVWRINDKDTEVAGYVRAVDNLLQVVIRAAGHIAPYDQPERCLDMVRRFVDDVPFHNLPNPAK